MNEILLADLSYFPNTNELSSRGTLKEFLTAKSCSCISYNKLPIPLSRVLVKKMTIS